MTEGREPTGTEPRRPRVLVVSAHPDGLARVAGLLEEHGCDVLGCPGPSTRLCVGLRIGHCVLADAADAVVLEADLRMEGPPSEELVSFYRARSLPVVQLCRRRELRTGPPEGGIESVAWPAPPGKVAAVVAEMLTADA